ncbi:hypothetical protein HC176_11155 [Tamlana crocina]|uniref:Uncharacterized protein n=1 Tax=Tamlana crocina TaxID=393006 RepID=A0ABX1DCH3_9FLAO|nr:hypothetical protein [Tamlana crocina]
MESTKKYPLADLVHVNEFTLEEKRTENKAEAMVIKEKGGNSSRVHQ